LNKFTDSLTEGIVEIGRSQVVFHLLLPKRKGKYIPSKKQGVAAQISQAKRLMFQALEGARFSPPLSPSMLLFTGI